jgi:23S rRNA pseudouridine2605 synthase
MTQDKPPSKPSAKPRPQNSARKTNSATPTAANEPTTVRLQRALASAGYGSRRQCEELIIEGRVLVDGKIVTELGVTVQPSAQKIYVDGTPLKPRRLVYYALNKPTGVVTTNVDPEGRPRVIDLIPPDERVFPVGRLDRSSEGLILLTNDGDLAQRLAHPSYEVSKVYRVTVAGRMEAETLRKMERGIYIAEGQVKVEGAKILRTRGRATELEITLKEGKNREIRRILARLGHKVQQLKRIAIGPLRLGEMPTGAYRKLSFEELKKLKTSVEQTARARARAAGQSESDDGDGSESRERRPSGRSAGRPVKGVRKGASLREGTTKKKFTKKAGAKFSDDRRPPSSKPVGSRTSSAPATANRRPLPRKKAAIEINVDRVKVGSVIGADPTPSRSRDDDRSNRKGAGKSSPRRDRTSDPDNRVTRTSKAARATKRAKGKRKDG